MIKVTLSFNKEELFDELHDVCEKIWVELPTTEKAKTELIQALLQESFESDHINFSFKLKTTLDKRIAAGETERNIEVLWDIIWEKEFALSPDMTEKEIQKMTSIYANQYVLDDKERAWLTRELSELAQRKFERNPLIVCVPLKEDCFPIEILKNLAFDKEQLSQSAFSIRQVELLLKRNRIYKDKAEYRGLQSGLRYLFLVKRLDGEVYLLETGYSPSKRKRHYTIHSWVFDKTREDHARSIDRWSKLYLNMPKSARIQSIGS